MSVDEQQILRTTYGEESHSDHVTEIVDVPRERIASVQQGRQIIWNDLLVSNRNQNSVIGVVPPR
jgi:hypothetical protein